jgi:hypothetical protein
MSFLLNKKMQWKITLYFKILPVYLVVIEKLMFITFKVYVGEISKNILFEIVFSDIKLSHLEMTLLKVSWIPLK